MEAKGLNTMLSANQLFIICAEEDKEYVIALQKNLRARRLAVWSMFKDDGDYSGGLGQNHVEVAQQELVKSCVAILLVSESSIRSGAEKGSFIFEEIKLFHSLVTARKIYHMQLIPICIGKDFFNCLPESWTQFNINSLKLSTTLRMKSTPGGSEINKNELNHACNEICNMYFECMNANYKYILENKYDLVVLGNRLMQSGDTVVKTISDDIRQTDENDSDSLNAIHLITNEISEYDCNAYSLMIISANLLGMPDRGMYDPAKNGVKYYYYCSQKYLEGIEEDYKNRITSFLRRDEEAITYADNSIREHYVVSQNIISYLSDTFQRKSVSAILLEFSIPETEKAQFMELLEQYDGDFYDSDTECVEFPVSFLEWLFGKKNVSLKAEVFELVFEFINQISLFLKSTPIHNAAKVEKLIGVGKMLDRIYNFHTYMHGKNSRLTHSKFSSIAKKVIGLKKDQNNTLIERWCIDRERSDEWENQDMEKVIAAAMQNVVFVPIKESDDFVLCNSFAVYDHRDKQTGKRKKQLVWYSTAHNSVQTAEAEKVSRNDEQEMLVVLNEKTTEQDCDVVRKALRYLKDMALIDDYYEF